MAAVRGSVTASRAAGFSLTELLVCVAVLGIAMTVSLADPRAVRQQVLVDGAARHLALALRAARTDAVRQGRSVAVQFLTGSPARYRVVADGNGNGVRRAEIDSGVDPVVGPSRRLDEDFPGVSFGVGCECGGIDGSEPPEAGGSGVEFGESALAVFTAQGTATSGTVYLRTGGGLTYAVRVLGTTGRTRVLRFDAARGEWTER